METAFCGLLFFIYIWEIKYGCLSWKYNIDQMTSAFIDKEIHRQEKHPQTENLLIRFFCNSILINYQ